ncbi:MAG: metallophosphoesterase [Candidatus Pacearchaeota archaeon]|nr:metallophosphoesterase [Candidatus Pacearchaeota archaeon]
MEIVKGIEIKGKALWLKKFKALVVADLHIGYEEALIEEGIFIPKTTFGEIKKEIIELLKLKPKIVVINGDLKHKFGEISKQEWHDVFKILDLLLKNKRKVILIKGNHDTILEPIARKKELNVVDYYCIDNICILHGHKILLDKEIHDKKIETLVIGHEHPAVSIRDGAKQEIYKCFLEGKWHNKNLIVMPSFFSVYEGSDIKKEKLLSPFLNENEIKNFEVYTLDETGKVYWFGKLKNIR